MPLKQKEATAPYSSVGADEGQSRSKTTESITNPEVDCNAEETDYDELMRKLQRMDDPNYLPYISMQQLYETVYTRTRTIIDDLLYAGTYILAGSPKVGKSFLAIQIAYHVSKGVPLWNHNVHQGTSLYLALEDPYRRLQKRLYQMFGIESTTHLKLATSCKPLGKGLEEQLLAFIQDYPDTKLIIIDVLQRIREDGGETYNYAKDYALIEQIKRLSDEKNICVLLIHHTRKQQASDKFDMISGTNGLFGAADGALVLSSNERTKTEATLDISGRDQQDQRLHLTRDLIRLTWEFDHAETEIRKELPDEVMMAVSRFITAENPQWEGTATELLTVLNLEMQPNALGMMLNIRAGRLHEDYQIRYESKRLHIGRRIFLTLETAEA